MIAALIAAALQAAAVPYVADGGEPFWSLEIAEGRLTYRRDGDTISAALPPRRATANGYRYETPVIVVEIRHEECADDGNTIRADSVTVTVGEETVRGCGGAVLETLFPDDG